MNKPGIGQIAPQFEIFNEDEKLVKLEDFKGKKLILFFYPKDDTPSCTKEACSLRDNYNNLRKIGFELLGVSPDKPAKHKKFIGKYELPYTLGSDPELKVLNDYGVWGKKIFMGREVTGVLRTTFIIDEESKISHVIDKVRTKDHADQIMELIGGN